MMDIKDENKKKKKKSITKLDKTKSTDSIKNIIKDRKKNKEKTTYGLLEVCVFSFIFMLFGILLGYMFTYGRDPYTGEKMSKNLEEFISTYNTIKKDYYGEINDDKLMDAAINGMVSAIDDPYSSFMNESVADDFDEEISGYYVGIGVTVSYENNKNEIIVVNKGDSADKAGIKVGDVIIRVDGNDVENTFGDDLSNLIRGEEGTTINITVRRGDEEKKFIVERKKIDIISVFSSTITKNDKKVGVIRIDKFASNTFSQFSKELEKLEKDGIDSLVIDVRDNLGGQLIETREILDLFFDKKTVLFQIKSNDKTVKIRALDNKKRNYPVAVLINNSSASASEVIAACFKDNYKKSYIVGKNSFGKGTIQKTKNLKSGSKIKYTIQKWLTPKGDWIEGEGLKPDYEVDNDEEYYNNPSNETDKQLNKAVDLLTK